MLDEDFFFYGEEEEWCHRIKRLGWPIVYYPKTSIIHFLGGSSKKRNLEPSLVARKAQIMVLRKTRGDTVAWLANLIMLLGLIPRMPVWLLADCLRSSSSSQIREKHRKRLDLLNFHLAALFQRKTAAKTAPAADPALAPDGTKRA
jgi:GT2 family glycosyltransferase